MVAYTRLCNDRILFQNLSNGTSPLGMDVVPPLQNPLTIQCLRRSRHMLILQVKIFFQ